MRFDFSALLILLAMHALPIKADALERRPVRIAIDRAPETLNPRRALDAIGQQLGGLLFSSLVHLNDDLDPVGDLAESWGPAKGGLEWRFKIKVPYRADHSGQPITSEKLLRCFENYRNSTVRSPVAAGLPTWKGTRLDPSDARTLIFELSARDPYFDKNSSLLRYFAVEGGDPCQEPDASQAIVFSGRYRAEFKSFNFDDRLKVLPRDLEKDATLEFRVIRDDSSRVLALLKGDVDVIQNGLSLTKTRYIEKHYANRFRLIERDGVNISYLAFNNADPILRRLKVRQAIAHAIDRATIVEFKMFKFGTIANSLLSPLLKEALVEPDSPFSRFAPELSRKLLDEEGFTPDTKTGVRLKLRYRTTPVREGIETALMIREMLSKVGIEIVIDVVEPAVFLSSIRKGEFQLYSSRYIGISDASILGHAFRDRDGGNRFKFKNDRINALIDDMMNEVRPEKRVKSAKEVQKLLARELPVLPLWFWNNAILINRDISVPDSFRLSLSGALEPLARLRIK